MNKARFSGAAVVGAVAVAAIVPGTAGASGTARDARVTGVVKVCGRPAPGRCSAQRGAISVMNAAGRVVATHKLAKGRYSFVLVPGRYTLLVKSPLGSTVATRPVTAKIHRTTRENIVIGIPYFFARRRSEEEIWRDLVAPEPRLATLEEVVRAGRFGTENKTSPPTPEQLADPEWRHELGQHAELSLGLMNEVKRITGPTSPSSDPVIKSRRARDAAKFYRERLRPPE